MSHLADLKGIESPRSSSDDFFTPVALFEQLHREFLFTFDPSGHELSPATQAIGSYNLSSGPQRVWPNGDLVGERIFCNPPYSAIGPWVEGVHFGVIRGLPLVVMLLPANKTEQPWWQDYIEPFRDGKRHALFSIETRFIRGRLKHGTPEDPEGKNARAGTFGSVLVIWRRS